MEEYLNKIICGDCLEVMKKLPDKCVDLTVTSPPYDNLRTYNGYSFDFEGIAQELYRITKDGGVVVWVVGDATINGSETGTSFRQALYFKEIGFNLHDTMLYKKKNTPFMRSNGYTNCFEFMFVLTKGKPKTFNPIKEKTVRQGFEMVPYGKGPEAINIKTLKELKAEKTKTNIWEYAVGLNGSTKDKIAFDHPAIFPENLAKDHILSWSNENDTILDPFLGSGTTAVACKQLNRNFIGIEISPEYCKIAQQRLNNLQPSLL